MKKHDVYIRSFFFLALAACFTLSCNAPKTNEVSELTSKAINDMGKSIADSLGRDAAIHYIDSALAVSTIEEIDLLIVYRLKLRLYNSTPIIADSALKYVDKALYLLNKHEEYYNNPLLCALLNNTKGDIYYSIKQYNSAYTWYSKNSLKIKSIPCHYDQYIKIASSLYNTERYRQALNYYKEAEEVVLQCHPITFVHRYRKQEFLNNIGLCYNGLQVYDSAYLFYEKAENYINTLLPQFPDKEQSLNHALMVTYNHKANLYIKQKEYQLAENYLLKALPLSIKESQKKLEVNLLLAKLYTLQEKYHDAEKQLNIIGTSIDVDSELLPYYNQLAYQYHMTVGNKAAAFPFLYDYNKWKDTLHKKQKDILTNDLVAGIQNKKIEHARILSSKNKKISLLFLIGLIFITTTAIFSIYGLVKAIRKQKVKFKAYRLHKQEKENVLQREIKEKKQKLLSIINNTDDVIWAIDKDMCLTTFNNAYNYTHKLFTGKDAVVGDKPDFSNLYKQEFLKWDKYYKRVLNGETITAVEQIKSELTQQKSDYEIKFWPLKDNDGNVTGAGCILRDITQYLETTRKVEAQNELLKEIADVHSHVFRKPVATMKGLFQFVNKQEIKSSENEKVILAIEDQVEELDRIIHIVNDKTKTV